MFRSWSEVNQATGPVLALLNVIRHNGIAAIL
jgi:hypothetical protein